MFYFRNGGHEEVYLSSADWMQRNLSKRLELLFPVIGSETPPPAGRGARSLLRRQREGVAAACPTGCTKGLAARDPRVRAPADVLQGGGRPGSRRGPRNAPVPPANPAQNVVGLCFSITRGIPGRRVMLRHKLRTCRPPGLRRHGSGPMRERTSPPYPTHRFILYLPSGEQLHCPK